MTTGDSIMKHHGRYDTASVLDIAIGIANGEGEYVRREIERIRRKHSNAKRNADKRKRKKRIRKGRFN